VRGVAKFRIPPIIWVLVGVCHVLGGGGWGGLFVFGKFRFFLGVHKFENNCFINGTNLPNFRNHKTEKRRRKKPLVGWKLFSDLATFSHKLIE
jgi:hypothetical protein